MDAVHLESKDRKCLWRHSVLWGTLSLFQLFPYTDTTAERIFLGLVGFSLGAASAAVPYLVLSAITQNRFFRNAGAVLGGITYYIYLPAF
jgi:hypothetical protein